MKRQSDGFKSQRDKWQDKKQGCPCVTAACQYEARALI